MSRTLRPLVVIALSTLLVVVGGAVPASAGGGGGCHAQELTDEVSSEVKAHENCFSPTVTRVDEGDRVTWFSGEFEAPHTVTGVAGGFGSGDLPASGRVSFTFDEPGVYPYSCLLHPGMVGAVVVGDGRAAASDAAAEREAAGVAAPEGTAPEAATSAASATSASSLLPWTLGLLTAAVAATLAVVLIRRRRSPVAPQV